MCNCVDPADHERGCEECGLSLMGRGCIQADTAFGLRTVCSQICALAIRKRVCDEWQAEQMVMDSQPAVWAKCCVCGRNDVCVADGYDTCSMCLSKQ